MGGQVDWPMRKGKSQRNQMDHARALEFDHACLRMDLCPDLGVCVFFHGICGSRKGTDGLHRVHGMFPHKVC